MVKQVRRKVQEEGLDVTGMYQIQQTGAQLTQPLHHRRAILRPLQYLAQNQVGNLMRRGLFMIGIS